jgi:hypothetical protein
MSLVEFYKDLAGYYQEFETFGLGGEGGLMEDALKKAGFKNRGEVKTQEDIDKLSKSFMEGWCWRRILIQKIY